jgi:hypothetical protein
MFGDLPKPVYRAVSSARSAAATRAQLACKKRLLVRANPTEDDERETDNQQPKGEQPCLTCYQDNGWASCWFEVEALVTGSRESDATSEACSPLVVAVGWVVLQPPSGNLNRTACPDGSINHGNPK